MSDRELQLKLAAMLQEKIEVTPNLFYWKNEYGVAVDLVRNTEWLHVVWLIEQGMSYEQRVLYVCAIIEAQQSGFKSNPKTYVGKLGCFALINASWQQRAAALIAVKVGKE